MNNRVFKEMMALIIPMTLQSFMLALVSATDALMLGFLDQICLSSVSLATQVQFLFNLLIFGVIGGFNIVCAQYWGKEDINSIEKIVPIALRVNVIGGLIFTLAALFVPDLLMKVLTNDALLIAKGAQYLRYVAFSYVLCGISQVYLAVMKNTGNAKLSSLISSVAVVFNIVADAVLIFGLCGFPKLGVIGAALATVLARLLECLWCLYASRGSNVQVCWEAMFNKTELEKDFWYYTWPAMMASLVWGIATWLYTIIIGHLNSDAVAAYSIASVSKQLVSCLFRGFGSAVAIYLGNLLGGDHLAEAKRYGGIFAWISVAMGLACGALLIVLSPFILSIVQMSDVAKDYLQLMLFFSAFNIAAQSYNFTVLDGIFCAGGDSRFDMLNNIWAMWLLSLPLGYLAAFVFKWPVFAVFVCLNMDEIVKIPLVIWRYFQYKWLRNITREA